MEKSATLETEATSFLLFVAGAFFLLEGLIHYEDFFVTSRAGNLVSIVLVVGSVAVRSSIFSSRIHVERIQQTKGFLVS